MAGGKKDYKNDKGEDLLLFFSFLLLLVNTKPVHHGTNEGLWPSMKVFLILRFVTGDSTLVHRYKKCRDILQFLFGQKNLASKPNLTCMVGRMGGGLYFLVEIELKMSKIPPFTYLKSFCMRNIFLCLKTKHNSIIF